MFLYSKKDKNKLISKKKDIDIICLPLVTTEVFLASCKYIGS